MYGYGYGYYSMFDPTMILVLIGVFLSLEIGRAHV